MELVLPKRSLFSQEESLQSSEDSTLDKLENNSHSEEVNLTEEILQNGTSPSQEESLQSSENISEENNLTGEQNFKNVTDIPEEEINLSEISELELILENVCQETCDLGKFNLNKISYKIRIEIDNTSMFLESFNYGLISDKNLKNESNITEEKDIQGQAILGEKVTWTKKITLENKGSVIVDLPKDAEKIKVNKIEDDKEKKAKANVKEISEDGTRISGLAIMTGFVTGSDNDIKEKQVEINDDAWEYSITYETPAPYSEESFLENGKGKQIKVVGPEEIHYENVLSFTNLEKELNVKNPSNLKIYWVENNTYVTAKKIEDKNKDGIYDYVEWTTPHLSNQTFEIIVITKAEHLNSDKEFISDIYEEVKELDDIWSPEILDGEYVRVTFEKNLTFSNDITIYPKIVSGNPIVEVYEINSDDKITEFNPILSNQYNKVYLTNLISQSQDVFDLKVVGGSLEFDHIIDPSTDILAESGIVALGTTEIQKDIELENEYNLTKAFIISRYTSGLNSNAEPDEATATVEFLNSTHIRIIRYSTQSHTTYVSYSILQANNIQAWNFTKDWALAEEEDDITLSSELPSNYNEKCFVQIKRNTRINSADINDFAEAEVLTNITNTTNINLQRDNEGTGNAAAGVSKGFVVCFLDETTVQTGTWTDSGTTAINNGINSVNVSNSWVIINHKNADDGVGQNAIRPSITSSTNLELKRDQSGGTVYGRYYIISFEEEQNSSAMTFQGTPASTNTDYSFTIPTVDLSRTILSCENTMGSGGGTAHTRDYWVNEFFNATSIRSVNGRTRTSSQTTLINCEVISWPTSATYVENFPPTTPTDITCDGNTNCNITIDDSVILNASGSTDEEGEDITYFLEASLLNESASLDLEESEKQAIASGEIILGESGNVTISGGAWKLMEFQNAYSSIPILIATPASQNTATGEENSALVPAISLVNETHFNITVCMDHGLATCEAPTNDVVLHYFVFDSDKIDDYDWIDGGTVSNVASTDNSVSTTLSFGASFSSTPYVFSSAVTYNQGGNISQHQWYTGVSTIGANMFACTHQGTADNCDDFTPAENISWIAIDPNNHEIKGLQIGTESISGSAWTGVSFSPPFTNTRIMVSQNSGNGNQDPQYPLARSVTNNSADIRYCEADGANYCDSHIAEDVMWFAVEGGDIKIGNFVEDTEAAKDWEVYSEIHTGWYKMTEINVTLEISFYDDSGSVQNTNNNPDLELEVYNGTHFVNIDNFSITGTGNFSLLVTEQSVLNGWQTSDDASLRIRGINFDYADETNVDEINWTNLWVDIKGIEWQLIGNHTKTTTLTWNTTNIDKQICINLRARAMDLDGSNSYSDYFTKNSCLNISHEAADTTPPTISSINISSSSGTNYTDENLYCNATISDDDSNYLNVSVKWYKNGELNLSQDFNNSYSSGIVFNSTLLSGNTSVGENWSCSLNLYDGEDWSGWGSSNNLTILEKSKSVSISTIYPSGDVNVTQNEFFKVIFNVTCTQGNCGAINVSLDPIGDVLFKDNFVDVDGTFLQEHIPITGDNWERIYDLGELNFNYSIFNSSGLYSTRRQSHDSRDGGNGSIYLANLNPENSDYSYSDYGIFSMMKQVVSFGGYHSTFEMTSYLILRAQDENNFFALETFN